jgi:serine/threonine protein kinase KIN1/2
MAAFATSLSQSSMAGNLLLGDYDIDLTVFGSGAQAKVVLGRHLVTQEKVAIKVFSLKTEQSNLCFENEARLLKLCQKEHIVEARSCFVHKTFGFLVMPFFKQDLLGFVMGSGGLEEPLAAHIFQQVCIAVDSCHSAGVAHLDIKPENILYDSTNKRAYLCDFGNSHQFSRGEMVNIGRRGTLVYCAPEVKKEENILFDPITADLWSLGILLHVIVAGFFPHSKGERDMELYHSGHVNLRFIQAQASPQLYDLLVSILIINPTDRSTIPEILNHPWMVHHTQRKASLANKLSKRFFASLS